MRRVFQSRLSTVSGFRQSSTSSASNAKGEVAPEQESPTAKKDPVSKPTVAKVAPAVKQEGESNTTSKIEKQIKDQPTVAKVAPAVKQEGESNTTMKIEKQIKDVDTDSKDYHDVKAVKK